MFDKSVVDVAESVFFKHQDSIIDEFVYVFIVEVVYELVLIL